MQLKASGFPESQLNVPARLSNICHLGAWSVQTQLFPLATYHTIALATLSPLCAWVAIWACAFNAFDQFIITSTWWSSVIFVCTHTHTHSVSVVPLTAYFFMPTFCINNSTLISLSWRWSRFALRSRAAAAHHITLGICCTYDCVFKFITSLVWAMRLWRIAAALLWQRQIGGNYNATSYIHIIYRDRD